MDAVKPQFDVLRGGNLSLPMQLNVENFVSVRAKEIAALTQAIEDPQRTGLAFQKLPKHMRRRAMSRSAKRVPKRLREAHMHQLTKSGLPSKTKKPSRKHRRRPTNLLEEYNRRQKTFVWLETHIWHAKRFHMIEKWGYKLPNSPCDKSFRACYRASANHCLLQDISYYCCIELNGQENQLLDKLQMLTSKECGLTFAAKAFLKGDREGSVMLFHQNTYPFGAIGRVNFLWKPLVGVTPEEREKTNLKRSLWIWVHPAFYQEVLDELILLFNFSEKDSTPSNLVLPDIKSDLSSNSETEECETSKSPAKKKIKLDDKKEKKNVEKTKLATRNVPFERTQKYRTNDGSIEMILLKDTLNRFRLTGPLSQAALLESIHIANVLEEKNSNGSSELDEKNWWKTYYNHSEEHKTSWSHQKTIWETLKCAASPAQLPPHFVLALTVTDPRMHLPSKRTKAVPDDQVLRGEHLREKMADLSPLASVSPIWSSDVRDQATEAKLSTEELSKIRSRNLVPSFTWEDMDIDSEDCRYKQIISEVVDQMKNCIPILLIQRPGSKDSAHKRLGFSSGWDIVMPAGWALPFWLGLIFRGARPGGLREISSIEFEASSEHLFAPDTKIGCKESEDQRIQLTEQHFRLPPDKRQNYIKYGITSPFACAWQILIEEWSQNSSVKQKDVSELNSQYFVLRDRKKIEFLKNVISNLKSKKLTNITEITNMTANSCLIHVSVYMHGKGNPTDNAIICLPLEEDLNNISKTVKYPGPVEKLHIDQYEEERKNVRSNHKILLKRLRRKRVREKLKQENLIAEQQEGSNLIPATLKRKKSDPLPTKDIIDEHAAKMQSLWLPQTKCVKDSCSREVIGFIKKGDFCFTEAQGVGQGYIAFPALLRLFRLCNREKPIRPMVLVRNTTSLQYRFGVIEIEL